MLSRSALQAGYEPAKADWLGANLSLIGRKVGEWRLLSDATASASEHWQSASVSRLVAALIRNARQLSQLYFFEVSSEVTWARFRREIETLLRGLWRDGVLGGRNQTEAFSVVCDRRSMTRADIDNGRLVADVQILPAQLIERIKVSLVLQPEGGA